ncbi:sugar kinase [Cellulomonas sp. WB94]|uniref:gluconokinase n=1 Tax=Cellulomonas sp. WB94 TaxID=2173174 RepID=UPI000D57BC95|nr:gluconokinase [Cellulomonas sp. WB94]PVU81143.1 sugar kinase [Cellulomonas sp. WB94]
MSAQTAGVHPPAEVIIGLDVGTTAAKVVAFGLGSPWRHTAIREYPLVQPAPGWQVQDPQAIAAAVQGALAECVDAVGGSSVVALSVSAAMHGLIGLDAKLRPLTPLVTWADARARDEARSLRESGLAGALYRTSGTPVHPMSPLTKLMWFSAHEPQLCATVRYWVGLKDYVLVTLTGTLATELSSASGTGMLDLQTRDWSPAAIDLAGISADQLPPVLPTTSALGLMKTVANRVGLPVGLPVVVGAADGPLGNLGTNAMAPGVVGLSLGTSGAVRMVVPEPMLDPDGRLFCYALTDEHWVIGGAVSNGGVVVRWAGGIFGRDLAGDAGGVAPDAALLALAESVPPGSDGLLMLPYLLAERAPLWDPDLTGAFLGIRHAHTRGHFVRAAVEGVALQLSTIVDRLDRIEPVTSVRATGGVFRSPLWRDIMAGALGRPVCVTGGAEGSALGAAALGLYALGRVSELGDGVGVLEPDDADASSSAMPAAMPEHSEVYARMRAAVPGLLAAYDDVARLFRSMGED